MNKWDCVVIGSGPCGISTAIYLKRYGFNPIVIGKESVSLKTAHKIENYYGIKSITGEDLYKSGIEQAKALGIEVIYDEVISIDFVDGFEVSCKTNKYLAKTIMLALGASRNKFALANKFEGKGVSYCATCDGFFYRKKKVGIIGNADYMLHEYEVLKNMIPHLTIFTNGEPLTVDVGNAKVVSDKIVSFNGDDHLQSITTTKETIEIYGCFIASGSQSGFTLAKHLGIGLNGNYIIVNEDKMTNIEGLFAGGDCIGGLLQVSKAVSDGAIAATSIAKFLRRS